MFVPSGILGKYKNVCSKNKRIFSLEFLNLFIHVSDFFRGLPVWLKYVPGMVFRTDNGPFKVPKCRTNRFLV